MNSQSTLIPIHNGRQLGGTIPGMFFTNSSCTWQIGAPSEWTDNSILKIKINRVVNSTCHINQGGTMLSARN